MIDCNEWKTEKRHECANMGKEKWLKLCWQLYVTWLPVRDLENFRPLDFSLTDCRETHGMKMQFWDKGLVVRYTQPASSLTGQHNVHTQKFVCTKYWTFAMLLELQWYTHCFLLVVCCRLSMRRRKRQKVKRLVMTRRVFLRCCSLPLRSTNTTIFETLWKLLANQL